MPGGNEIDADDVIRADEIFVIVPDKTGMGRENGDQENTISVLVDNEVDRSLSDR